MHTKDELELFLGDPNLAEHAAFLEMLGSWLAVKILDILSSGKPISTSDLARQSHADIESIKEVLRSLSEGALVISESEADGTKMWRLGEPSYFSIKIDGGGFSIEKGSKSIHAEEKLETKPYTDLIAGIEKTIVESRNRMENEFVKHQRRQNYMLIGVGITSGLALASIILQLI